MKQTLHLKISQHLTLTPQLQQSIKLLQLSTLEMNQEIERILTENPLLERTDTDVETYASMPSSLSTGEAGQEHASSASDEERQPQSEEYDNADAQTESFDSPQDWGEAASSTRSRDDEDESDYQDYQAASVSLRDHLNQQISLSSLSDRDRALVRLLIEALDDDGYLKQAFEDLLAILPPEDEYDLEDLGIALSLVQSLEPVGIGARSPQECLSLQLRALPETPIQQLARHIVEKHLELLAERNFAKLKRVAACSDEALREAHALICSLNPHPGLEYGTSETRYIIPDVSVKKIGKHWRALLNQGAMPKLRVNALYASILQQGKGGGESSLNAQLQEARWLIKNVQQRFDTILRVSQAIVDRQHQFFDYGEIAMKPLTLREIAEQLELHESTISRVTTQKFMATPRGIIELKYFFGSHVATDTGGTASSTAIRALIRQLVDAENKKKPLSDSKITDMLGEQGIVVARRTIAKYRELLNIPTVSQRKII